MLQKLEFSIQEPFNTEIVAWKTNEVSSYFEILDILWQLLYLECKLKQILMSEAV